jgi:nicotinamidase/pyrazinamidase
MKSAFILIDYQNDFVDPAGALYVKGAEKLAKPIQAFLRHCKKADMLRVASLDRHPHDHMSFASQHGVNPFTQIDQDMKRPDHCVADTRGAQFFPPLEAGEFDHIVLKAMEHDKDSYSAFGRTDLDAYLQKQHVSHLVIGGVATDYCVNATVQDALKHGYKVTVLSDLIAAVSPE